MSAPRLPIIMLSGQAGSGKDTVAGFLVRDYRAVAIAQADPMKRLARDLFGFTDEQLWGPSHMRDALAPRGIARHPFDAEWAACARPWVDYVTPDGDRAAARYALWEWYQGLAGKPLTARRVLQTLGTEWGRAFSKQMWVDLAIRNARELLRGGYRYDRGEGLVPDAGVLAPNWVAITDGRFRNEVLAVREAGGVVVRIDSPGAGLRGPAAAHVSETEQASIPAHFFDAMLVNDKAHGLTACGRTVAHLMSKLGSSPSIYATGPSAPFEGYAEQ